MSNTITRKQFLSVTVAAIVVPSLGCDDGDASNEGDAEGEEEGGGDCSAGADGTIASNHGHAASVPAADITAAAAKDYDIMGSSPHTHTISLSTADFAALAAGERVTVTSSSGGGHTHGVTLEC